MRTPVVSIYTSFGGNNNDPFSEVELGGCIALCRFHGEDNDEKAARMANELNALIHKYHAMEVEKNDATILEQEHRAGS